MSPPDLRETALLSKTLNLVERYKKISRDPKNQNAKLQLSFVPQTMRLEAEPGAGLFQQEDQEPLVTPRSAGCSDVPAALRGPSLLIPGSSARV